MTIKLIFCVVPALFGLYGLSHELWELVQAQPQLSVLHPGVTSRLWFSLAFFAVFSIGSVFGLISVVATLR